MSSLESALCVCLCSICVPALVRQYAAAERTHREALRVLREISKARETINAAEARSIQRFGEGEGIVVFTYEGVDLRWYIRRNQ